MIFANIDDYPTIEAVRDAYPSAAEIVLVDHGWAVFETKDDADTWFDQE
jgi:hypothetical protein